MHGAVEVFNGWGRRLGSMGPITGEMIKPAVSGRTIDVSEPVSKLITPVRGGGRGA
ncbi:MAG: hypothetical protein ACREE1_09345 [Stellaceae bacterium]